ncbi:M28 family peptidase [Acidobacteriota bacterium]
MNKTLKIFFVCSFLVIALASLVAFSTNRAQEDKPLFTENEYKAHLKFLADDLLEGRAPGAHGGDLAALYIASQFEAAGLKPITEENGYFQQVPLIGMTTDYESLDFKLSTGDESKTLKAIEDIVLYSELPQEDIHLEEELIFVGYGVDAPEFGWDDFKDVDVTGKILLTLIGHPDYEQTGFGTESSPYYIQSEYKRAITRLKGAKGCIQIHADEISRFPFFSWQNITVSECRSLENLSEKPLNIYGYISRPAIDAALSLVGLSFEQLKQKADSRDFCPIPIDLKTEIHFKHNYRKIKSPNVIGILPGSSTEEEAVIYMAHYDHLGIRRTVNGDNIYNGAMDNASGTAALICLARAFASSSLTKRSIIFLALTAEEDLMLGSWHYVLNPILPLEKTIIGLNLDGLHFLGREDGFGMFPVQYTNAVPTFQRIAKELGLKFHYGRVDRGGGAFRTDHYPFCTQGVVALSISQDGSLLDYEWEEVKKLLEQVGEWYHKPTDEIYPFWRYEGIVQIMTILHHAGRYYANDGERPSMNPENPFNAPKRIFEELYKDTNKKK